MTTLRANSPWRILKVSVTGSTNADLLDRARSGEPAGTVLVADHQTAGRGRLDRRWEAPPGTNLLCSILFRPTAPPDEWFRLTAAVAVAAARAVAALGVEARIKWPNDLLVGDEKLAGVLAETDGAGGVVVGLGCNTGWPAAGEMAGATSLAAHGVATTPARLLDALLAELAFLVAPDGTTADPRRVLDEVRARSATVGRAVRIDLPDGSSVQGRAVAIDDDGCLVLETAGEPARDGGAANGPALVRRRFATGDVVHARLT